MEIHYVMEGRTVTVSCGYDKSLNTMFSIAGGVWDDYTKKWLFDKSDWERLLPVLLPHYTIVDGIMDTRYTPSRYRQDAAHVIITQIDEMLAENPDNLYRMLFYLEFAGAESLEELPLTGLQELFGYMSKNRNRPIISLQSAGVKH